MKNTKDNQERYDTQFVALIGLDWGDQSHAVALEPAGGPIETSTLVHSSESLHQWLDQLQARFAGRPVAVAIETDRGAVVYALLERPWITIYPIHPATSTRHRTMFRPSGAADDLPDALVLLSLLQHHRDRLRPLQPDDELTRTLAGLVQARRKAVDRRTLLGNQLLSTLKDYFPQATEPEETDRVRNANRERSLAARPRGFVGVPAICGR